MVSSGCTWGGSSTWHSHQDSFRRHWSVLGCHGRCDPRGTARLVEGRSLAWLGRPWTTMVKYKTVQHEWFLTFIFHLSRLAEGAVLCWKHVFADPWNQITNRTLWRQVKKSALSKIDEQIINLFNKTGITNKLTIIDLITNSNHLQTQTVTLGMKIWKSSGGFYNCC